MGLFSPYEANEDCYNQRAQIDSSNITTPTEQECRDIENHNEEASNQNFWFMFLTVSVGIPTVFCLICHCAPLFSRLYESGQMTFSGQALENKPQHPLPSNPFFLINRDDIHDVVIANEKEHVMIDVNNNDDETVITVRAPTDRN